MRARQRLANAQAAQERQADRQDAEAAQDGGHQREAERKDVARIEIVQQVGHVSGGQQKDGCRCDPGLVGP
jgi:hypothetical protein